MICSRFSVLCSLFSVHCSLFSAFVLSCWVSGLCSLFSVRCYVLFVRAVLCGLCLGYVGYVVMLLFVSWLLGSVVYVVMWFFGFG